MLKINFFLVCFLFFLSFNALGQQSSNNEQKELLNELIELKKELTNSNKLKEFYLIQLYSGNLKDAEYIKKDFDKQFDMASTIKYESPNYKVWVGNFRTRLEADRAMLEIKEVFENAFIIKPGRN